MRRGSSAGSVPPTGSEIAEQDRECRRKRVAERSSSTAGNAGYKRSFDLTLLVVAGVLLAPLWLILVVVVAVAIRLDDGGPVFYAQRRLGRGGRPFNLLKFRTMVQGAERRTGPVWASEDDPRITRVGAVLRRLHIDEIPQAVNIARGEMSWVGPRPERPEIAARIEATLPSFADRLAVPPGIAGMEQLHRKSNPGRSRDKLRYDRLYIEKMAPLVDLGLIAQCVAATLAKEARRLRGRRPSQQRQDAPGRSHGSERRLRGGGWPGATANRAIRARCRPEKRA